MSYDESCCMRCRRANPEADEGSLPTDWEVLTDARGEVVGVMCSGCITGEEQRAIDDDMMELGDEIARRQEWEDLD